MLRQVCVGGEGGADDSGLAWLDIASYLHILSHSSISLHIDSGGLLTRVSYSSLPHLPYSLTLLTLTYVLTPVFTRPSTYLLQHIPTRSSHIYNRSLARYLALIGEGPSFRERPQLLHLLCCLRDAITEVDQVINSATVRADCTLIAK